MGRSLRRIAAKVAVCFLFSTAAGAQDAGTWSTMGQTTTVRTEIGGVEINGKVYVIGGGALGREDSPLAQEFDPASGHWRDLAPYRDVDLDAYWAGEIRKFGLNAAAFAGRRALDVGCGPVGLIHFLPQAAMRVRLDPLLHIYEGKLPLALSVSAAGEQLPLQSGQFDLLICFNALDHMRDPAVALAEMKRVMRPGATLLLMIHTFPAWTMPLLAVDRLHPHHWTHRQFIDTVAKEFRVVHEHRERRTFSMSLGQRLRPAMWKYSVAGAVLYTTYVTADFVI